MGFMFGLVLGLAIPMFCPQLFNVIHDKVLVMMRSEKK